MHLKILPAVLLAFLSTACADAQPQPQESGATLDPVAFFTGSAEGEATLNVVMSGKRSVRVHSEGRPDGNGGLILIQQIREGDKPERVRTWTMQPLAPGRYTGTLTPDAIGPVSIIINGSRAEIAYRMKSGMTVAQTLMLRADGRTIDNRLRVKKWGVQVAELDEVITKTR